MAGQPRDSESRDFQNVPARVLLGAIIHYRHTVERHRRDETELLETIISLASMRDREPNFEDDRSETYAGDDFVINRFDSVLGSPEATTTEPRPPVVLPSRESRPAECDEYMYDDSLAVDQLRENGREASLELVYQDPGSSISKSSPRFTSRPLRPKTRRSLDLTLTRTEQRMPAKRPERAPESRAPRVPLAPTDFSADYLGAGQEQLAESSTLGHEEDVQPQSSPSQRRFVRDDHESEQSPSHEVPHAPTSGSRRKPVGNDHASGQSASQERARLGKVADRMGRGKTDQPNKTLPSPGPEQRPFLSTPRKRKRKSLLPESPITPLPTRRARDKAKHSIKQMFDEFPPI